jgi:hypothetical protein
LPFLLASFTPLDEARFVATHGGHHTHVMWRRNSSGRFLDRHPLANRAAPAQPPQCPAGARWCGSPY